MAATGPGRAASPLTLRLFGPFEVRLNGEPLPRLRTRKGQGLLALLALRHGAEVERSWLGDLLWPSSTGSHALRNSLTDLRRAMGSQAGRLRSVTSQTLCLDLTGAEVDVIAFDEAIARGDGSSLETAVLLYRGPLLEGCVEEWVVEERQAREQAYLGALERLAAAALAQGDPAAAEGYLRRVVPVDPLRESAQRALMQALAMGGSYAGALVTYRELRLLLQRELNADPDLETQALFAQIRAEARDKAALGSGLWALGRDGDRACAGRLVAAAAQSPEPRAQSRSAATTLTFLFTDVEGSSRLWEQHPEAMGEALARHDDLLRQAIAAHGGHLFKTMGDAACAAFPTAAAALDAVLAAQRSLSADDAEGRRWRIGADAAAFETKRDGPNGPGSASFSHLRPSASSVDKLPELRVRMALHTGTAQERDGDYFGPTLNRIARLLDTGHGGQILLSLATVELVRDQLPPGADLRDLGERRLPDLSRPEQIFQLVVPDLPANFPPLRSLETFRHNLPLQLTSFIGREGQMAEVKQLLATRRLVTLTGAGGCGKTRLALQVAADLLGAYADGVWLVELAALADPALVPRTVAEALGVREEPGRPVTQTLLDYLRGRSLLLVLDNCEHLVAACAHLAETLLQASPKLRVLATSREPLGMAGENPHRVPSLSLPEVRALPSLERLTQYEAVVLFIERAATVLPTFRVTDENAPAVAEVCRRLDGIPLAIELAAARVKALPVEQIAERLDDRFRLLTGGSRTALPRQQTLRASIDWSYHLLPEPERLLLRRLSVFAGGWTLEAAEEVAALPTDDRARILIQARNATDDGRAAERDPRVPTGRTPSGETEVGTAIFTAAVGRVTRLNQDARSVVGRHEVLDLLSALVDKSLVQFEERSAEHRGPSTVGGRYRLLETVRQFGRDHLMDADEAERVRRRHQEWYLRYAERVESEFRESDPAAYFDSLEREHDNLRAALEWSEQEGGDVEAGLRLAHAMEWFWEVRGHWQEGRKWFAELLARAGSDLQPALRARALLAEGSLAFSQWDYEPAVALFQKSRSLFCELGDKKGIAQTLRAEALVPWNWGEYARATSLVEESLALFRELGDQRGIYQALGLLSHMAADHGDWERATALVEEGRPLAHELGHRGHGRHVLAIVAMRQGEYEQAKRLFEERLIDCRKKGDRVSTGWVLAFMGQIALRQGEVERAARLGEESLALLRAVGRKTGMAEALAVLGKAARRQGDDRRARALLMERVAALRELEERPGLAEWRVKTGIAECLEELGEAARARGQLAGAARLFGSAAALREGAHAPAYAGLSEEIERGINAVQVALGEEAFAAAWAAGRAMSMEHAAALALEAGGTSSSEAG